MVMSGSRGPRTRYTEELTADAVAMVTELSKSRSQVAAGTCTTGRGRGSHNKPADPNSTDPDQFARWVAELEAENALVKKRRPSSSGNPSDRQIPAQAR